MICSAKLVAGHSRIIKCSQKARVHCGGHMMGILMLQTASPHIRVQLPEVQGGKLINAKGVYCLYECCSP